MDILLNPQVLWLTHIGNFPFFISSYTLTLLLWPTSILLTLSSCIRCFKFFKFFCMQSYMMLYDFFFNYLDKKGEKYISFLMSLMMFIIILNCGNLVPLFYPCTTSLALTFSLALIVFILVVGVGIYEHGFKFVHFFIPKGVPTILKPFLFVIEVLSFLIRPLSLAMRLGMNMIAGHIIMEVIATFVSKLCVMTLVSVLFLGVVGIFEIGVAILQGFVFALLGCIYISDILNLH